MMFNLLYLFLHLFIYLFIYLFIQNIIIQIQFQICHLSNSSISEKLQASSSDAHGSIDGKEIPSEKVHQCRHDCWWCWFIHGRWR